jgi:hypothetical protein
MPYVVVPGRIRSASTSGAPESPARLGTEAFFDLY